MFMVGMCRSAGDNGVQTMESEPLELLFEVVVSYPTWGSNLGPVEERQAWLTTEPLPRPSGNL